MIPTFSINEISESVLFNIQARKRERQRQLSSLVFDTEKQKKDESIFRQMNTQQVQNIFQEMMEEKNDYDLLPDIFSISGSFSLQGHDGRVMDHSRMAQCLYNALEGDEQIDFETTFISLEYPEMDMDSYWTRDDDFGVVDFYPYDTMTFQNKTIKGWEWPRSTFVPHLSTTIEYPVHTISLGGGLVKLYGVQLNNKEFIALEKMDDGSFREAVDASGTTKVISLDNLPPMTSMPTLTLEMSNITINLSKKTTDGSLDNPSGKIVLDTLDTNNPKDKATRAFRVDVLEDMGADIGSWINNVYIGPEMLNDFKYNEVEKSSLSDWAQRTLIEQIKAGHITVSPA